MSSLEQSSEYRDFRGLSDQGLAVEFKPDRDQVAADVHLGQGVILELTRDADSEEWQVWAVRIDGVLYREPRDLTGEPLRPGRFLDELRNAEASGREYL